MKDTRVPESFDVVILGAGVNGAGLFRDLCEQGVRCLLVEKNDFGSGTSAAPSRLIHGGLKYLETGELGLVAESTLERNLLLKNAPHYVQPLSTVIPVFSWTNGIWPAVRTLFGSTTAPRSRGALLVKLGLTLYDFYGSRHRVMPRHRFLSRKNALHEIPAITPDIVAAGNYYDARISHPERLVLELVKDGLSACPAAAAVNATQLIKSDQGHLTFRSHDDQTLVVKPRIVVNAAGPWIDKVNELLGEPTRLIGGTKGSHAILDHPALMQALDGRMIYFEADDGRICLVFEYLGRVLVGSTDIAADSPDDVRCEDSEITYFLASLRSLFPQLKFDREQVVYTYSGIRPLLASDAAIPGLISRDHSAPVLEPTESRPFPVYSLVGGKWTTFRGFAEEVTNSVLDRLGLERALSTKELAIGGGRNFPVGDKEREAWITELGRQFGLSVQRAKQLLQRYGTAAHQVAEHSGPWRDSERLPDSDTYSLAELDWIMTNEMVINLEDVVMRRTTLAVTGTLTIRDLGAVAEVAAYRLQWSNERERAEVEHVAGQLRGRHHMKMAPSS